MTSEGLGALECSFLDQALVVSSCVRIAHGAPCAPLIRGHESFAVVFRGERRASSSEAIAGYQFPGRKSQKVVHVAKAQLQGRQEARAEPTSRAALVLGVREFEVFSVLHPKDGGALVGRFQEFYRQVGQVDS